MSRISKRLVLIAAVLAVSSLAACFKLPSVRFDSPFGQSNWVVFEDSIVVGPPTPALAGNFVNQKGSSIVVRIEVDEIEGGDDCANSISLAAKETKPYACPQSFVAAGKRFRIDVRVYKDLGGTDLVERIQRHAELQVGEDGELVLVGRPLE